MLVPLNIALGLTVPVACVIGAGIFMITVFSVNATIISGGFILTGAIALGLVLLLNLAVRRVVSKGAGSAPGPLTVLAHGLLLASNLTAFIGAPLLAYDSVLGSPSAGRSPFSAETVIVAIGACAVLSIGLLITSSRRRATA